MGLRFTEPGLEFLFEAEIQLEPPQRLGATPLGGRAVYIVTSGTFTGPRLRGTVLPGGGDWFLARANGIGELDVRATLRTDDGALILMTYHGVLDASADVVARVFAGEDVDPAEYYFRTAPRFETGDERYAWLNGRVAVASGRFAPGSVAYRAYLVT
jgi:hypothetical protein